MINSGSEFSDVSVEELESLMEEDAEYVIDGPNATAIPAKRGAARAWIKDKEYDSPVAALEIVKSEVSQDIIQRTAIQLCRH